MHKLIVTITVSLIFDGFGFNFIARANLLYKIRSRIFVRCTNAECEYLTRKRLKSVKCKNRYIPQTGLLQPQKHTPPEKSRVLATKEVERCPIFPAVNGYPLLANA